MLSMASISKYNPNRSSEWNYGGEKWRLSRSKIDLFTECPRCFYLDNKLGTKRPSIPAFNLNIAVDELFKKEFDHYRAQATPHPIQSQYGIDAIPFSHPDIDTWRDPFVGISYRDTKTNLIISGGIDDVWVQPDNTLIVIDYKSTSKDERIEKLGDSPWEVQYTRQLGIYRYLLEKNGFTVSPIGYLVYANARKSEPAFNNVLSFETTLVPCQTTTDWIPTTIAKIKDCLESDAIPAPASTCEYCQYREASGRKFLAIHRAQKNI
jgi:CRISPR/Cas system-associated exonuclease Cas4 (RecB family)